MRISQYHKMTILLAMCIYATLQKYHVYFPPFRSRLRDLNLTLPEKHSMRISMTFLYLQIKQFQLLSSTGSCCPKLKVIPFSIFSVARKTTKGHYLINNYEKMFVKMLISSFWKFNEWFFIREMLNENCLHSTLTQTMNC